MTSDASLSQEPPASPEKWSFAALFTIAYMGVVSGLQLSDLGLQAISLSAIQRSFGVGDATVGLLQGLGNVLIGSVLAIPLARLADRFSRKRLLICLVAAATGLTVCSALAPTFPLFFLFRSAAGVTDFAMIPLVYSMIPDLAPERHRVASNLSFAALMAVGASAGFYFSGDLIRVATGLITLDIEPWRKAFLLLSSAGVPLFFLGFLTKNPPRHLSLSNEPGTESLKAFFLENWRMIGLFVGTAGCLMIAVQAPNQLIALAFERRFSAEVGVIGQAMGIIVLCTSLACLPVAGLLDKFLSRRLERAARPLIMGAGALIAIPVIALLSTTTTIYPAFIVIGAFLFVTSTANALVPTMLQDLTTPALRARCFAIWSFVVSVFSATGPMIAGSLSEWFLQHSLMSAIILTAVPGLFLSAFFAVRLFQQFRRTRLSVSDPLTDQA